MSYKKLLSISNGFIQNLKKYGKIYSIMSRKIFIDDFLLARYDQKLYGCHHCLILVVLCTIISGFNVVDFRKNLFIIKKLLKFFLRYWISVNKSAYLFQSSIVFVLNGRGYFKRGLLRIINHTSKVNNNRRLITNHPSIMPRR